MFNITVDPKQLKHAVDMNLDLMKTLGLDVSCLSDKLILNLTDKDRIFASGFLNLNNCSSEETLIAMHATGAGVRSDKCWPVENFVKLAQRLCNDKGVKILLLGSSAEFELSKKVQEILPMAIINAVGKTTLKQTGALIEKCNIFVGNDSALMHVASAVGVPILAIFGPTDPRIYSPYGVVHRIVRNKLDCSPCAWGVCGEFGFLKENIGFDKGAFYCKKRTFECIKNISVEEVYSKTIELLKVTERKKG